MQGQRLSVKSDACGHAKPPIQQVDTLSRGIVVGGLGNRMCDVGIGLRTLTNISLARVG
jgi:hypothetical protein